MSHDGAHAPAESEKTRLQKKPAESPGLQPAGELLPEAPAGSQAVVPAAEDPRLRGAAGGAVQASLMLQMQRTAGNRAVQRFIGRDGFVQREGEGETGAAPAAAPASAAAPAATAAEPAEPASLEQTLQQLLDQDPIDEAAVEQAMRDSSQAECDKVHRNVALMDRLRDELSEASFGRLQLIMQGVLGLTEFTNTTDTGNRYSSMLAMMRTNLLITKEVHFVQTGTFAHDDGFDTMQQRTINSVRSYLNKKYKIKIESGGGAAREGDGEYPILVRMGDSSGSQYEVRLHGGEHGRSAVNEEGGDLYELGQESETSIPDVVLAHECAHMILGANDEYANEEIPARQLYTDNSLMANFYEEGMEAAELKPRHFGFLLRLVAQWFPDRTISIVS